MIIYTAPNDYPIDDVTNDTAAALHGLVVALGEPHDSIKAVHDAALYHALRAGGSDVIELRHAIRHAPESLGVMS